MTAATFGIGGELEYADHFGEHLRFFLQRCGCAAGLFDHGGILPGRFVHLADGMVHRFDAGALFLAGQADLCHDVGYAFYATHNLFHRSAGIVNQARADFNPLHRTADQGLDFVGGRSRTLSQVTHLGCHDSKAAALLAGASRFHGGIERQDIGLKCNRVDHADDVDNLL